jgi:site-specific DNA-methyltransferase (adenine-specific)
MSALELPRNTVLVGDARSRLSELPDHFIDTVITSPPYFQLRNYQVKEQIGLEADANAWVEELRSVTREVARVLKPTGSLWLNLGDSYSRHPRTGSPPKSLLLAPERLALALIEDGWIVRNKIIWSKTNAMPASVRDRLACSWEVVYFLVRSKSYYFDLDAIRVPHRSASRIGKSKTAAPPLAAYPPSTAAPSWSGPLAGNNTGLAKLKALGLAGHPLGANPRDVWQLATANFHGDHFATFPTSLVERPLLATCPERTCSRCGRPWLRDPVRTLGQLAVRGELRPGCRCRQGWRPGVVLDPFFGAGTVGLVAEANRRDWLGVELNPHFADLAKRRIETERRQPNGRQERSHAA